MKKTTLLAAALLTTVSSVALAENSSQAAPKPAPQNIQRSTSNVRQQLATDLQQSGFTNIKVMPELVPSSSQ